MNSLRSCRESYDGVIFVVNGYCFSILISGQHVYVTDSHSRDSEGRPSSQGTAVVLKFSSFFELARYILEIYCCTSQLTQYDIQFVKIEKENLTNIICNSVIAKHKSQSQSEKLQNQRKAKRNQNLFECSY